MGFYKDQKEICAPYINLVEPLNERMRQNAITLAKQRYGIDLDLQKVATFTAVYGKDYDRSGENGIAFYGRANNGWDEETEDFCMESITEMLNRPFFNLMRYVSEHYFDDWFNHVAYCNAYKMIPFGDIDEDNKWMFQNCQNTNPSQIFRQIQLDVATEITKQEQDFLNPLVSILVTGYYVEDSWDETIWSNYPNYKQIGEDDVWYEDSRGKCIAGLFQTEDGRFFIQTDRPEMRPIGKHAEAIIKLIDEVKLYKQKHG